MTVKAKILLNDFHLFQKTILKNYFPQRKKTKYLTLALKNLHLMIILLQQKKMNHYKTNLLVDNCLIKAVALSNHPLHLHLQIKM